MMEVTYTETIDNDFTLFRYYRNGKLHRDGLPARMEYHGSVVVPDDLPTLGTPAYRHMWYRYGKIANPDGPDMVISFLVKEIIESGDTALIPATVEVFGYTSKKRTVITKLDGKTHSFNDQPALVLANGVKEWHNNGQRHRLGDYAVLYPSGTCFWYENGELHNPNGPAIVTASGSLWYANGQSILPKQVNP
jgi:hypothetical protein